VIQDIYIGVDGGASKCKLRVEEASGKLLGEGLGGPANIRLSVQKTWESIQAPLREILQARGISIDDPAYRFHAGLGLAGLEVNEAKINFLKHPHPFTTLSLVSDAHIACLGAHAGQAGSIIIIGTGVIAYQIQETRIAQVGGWGFPHDDEGGGAWLGLEASRLCFQFLDKRRETSPLVESVFAFFNRDKDAFITWANAANSSEFARLAPLVIQHREEDPHAQYLLKRASLAIQLVADALDRQASEILPCSLFGGLATFIEPLLSDTLRNRFRKPLHDPNHAALQMIRDVVKIKAKECS
jgi:glucosamine kinase